MSPRALGRVSLAATLGLGCQVDNPLYTASEGVVSEGGSGTDGSGSGGSGSGGSGSGGSGSGGSGASTSSTGGTSTGTTGASEGTTTLEPACPNGTMQGSVPLPEPVENGLVVSPNAILPCAWPTPDDVPIDACAELNLYDLAGPQGHNYGNFDLAADPDRGTAYYLVRFDSGELKAAINNLPGELIGFRFTLAVYQGQLANPQENHLGVLALTPADIGWIMSEASYLRAAAASPWSGGDLAKSLVPVSELVTPTGTPNTAEHFVLESATFALPMQAEMIGMGLSLVVRHEEPYPRPYSKGTYMVEALDSVAWEGARLWAVVCEGP